MVHLRLNITIVLLSLFYVIWLGPSIFLKSFLILTLFKLLVDKQHKNNNRFQQSQIVLVERITLLWSWGFFQTFLQGLNILKHYFLLFRCTSHIDIPGMPTLKFPPIQIPIGVNDNCIDRRKVVYILARILGLPDEHTRPDRDQFLTIHTDNIKSKVRYIVSDDILD